MESRCRSSRWFYAGSSIATTFAITAAMFGALVVFGSTTKRSLAGAGQFFYMGLVGLVLASLLRLFWQNDALEFLISVVGVIVFTGLTAWDAQRLKHMAAGPQGGEPLVCHHGRPVALGRRT
jgi:uncharacterized protein